MFSRLLSASVLGLAIVLVTPIGFAEERGATPVPAQDSAGTQKAIDSKKQSESHRRKRGGPSDRPTETNATPAEGQNDLIKVLQPGSRQKTNQ